MKLRSYGAWTMTRGIHNAALENEDFEKEIERAVKRYLNNDWGDLDDEDKAVNEYALRVSERILGRYETSKGAIYIITERDRSATTILFANEY